MRFTALLFTVLTSAVAAAQPVENQTAVPEKEVAELVRRAGHEGQVVSALKMRLRGSRLFYDVEFEENDANRQWLFRLNLTADALKTFEEEATGDGFAEAFTTSVRTRRGRLYSAVWIKGDAEPKALTLPEGRLPETGTTAEHLAPIDNMVRSFLQRHNASGCTLAIFRHGQLLYSRGFGYADVESRRVMQPETPMRIASIAKPLTAAAVLILTQQHKLSLNDRVLPLLVGNGYTKPPEAIEDRWSRVTVQNVLHHSGGWDLAVSGDPMFKPAEITRTLKLRQPITPADVVRYQLTRPIDFEPGSRYVYANFGYALLGRIVEIAADQPYAEAVSNMVLRPSRMEATRPGRTRREELGDTEARYHMQMEERSVPVWSDLQREVSGDIKTTVANPYGRWLLELMDAGGGWVSTAPDLCRFVSQLDAETAPLLTEESRSLLVSRPSFTEPSAGSWYGCGWQVRPAGHGDSALNRHNIWHSGALAGTSTLLVRRHDGFVWAILFNTDSSAIGGHLASLIDPKIHHAVDSVAW